MSGNSFRFVPSLESLDARINLSTVTPTGTVAFRIDGGERLQDDETLVFFLGGIPSAAETHAVTSAPVADHPDLYLNVWVPGSEAPANDGRKYKMLVAPLIIESDNAEGREVRYRMFAIVDRTPSTDGVVLLNSSLPGGSASASKDMVLKGSKILQNAPVDVGGNEVITIGGNRTELTGESTTAQRRNLVTLLSADLEPLAASPEAMASASREAASGPNHYFSTPR